MIVYSKQSNSKNAKEIIIIISYLETKISIIMKLLWISLLLIAVRISCLDNKAILGSHYDFTSVKNLGRDEQVDLTFLNIQNKITQIGNVTYNSTPTTFYTIFNAKPTFFVNHSNQEVRALGNNTILSLYGILLANITFDWCKIQLNEYSLYGTGAVTGKSDRIGFAYAIELQTNKFWFQLLDYERFIFTQNFQITQLFPVFATEEDKSIITKMFNYITDSSTKTIRSLLEENIDLYYGYYLSNNIQYQNRPSQFAYIWNPGYRSCVTIPIVVKLISLQLSKDKFQAFFDVRTKNDENWRPIQRPVPILPYNPDVYGGNQGFVSFDFYENMIRYAAINQILDTKLNRANWGTPSFHFVAGNMFQVIPQLKAFYSASEVIYGHCWALHSDAIKVVKSSIGTFNVSIEFDCELQTRREKFVNFQVGLELSVRGEVRQKEMFFKVNSFEESVSFHAYPNYKIEDEALGRSIIRDCLKKMQEGQLFGSGFPTGSFKDQNLFVAAQNFSATLDPSFQRRKATNIEME